jgi:amidase
VALALDMVPLADGSDYGGSLRNPAAWNNVYGFRTGMDASSRHQRRLVAFARCGRPMARNRRGSCADAVGHGGARRPCPAVGGVRYRSLAHGRTGVLARQADRLVGRFRWCGPVRSGCLDTCRQALERFAAMGADIVEVVPDFPVEEAWRAFVGLRHWINGSGMIDLYRDPAKRAGLKPEAIWEIEGGMALSAYDVSALSAVRTRWSRAVAAVFRRCDLWIVPSAQVFPFPHRAGLAQHVGGETMTSYHEWMKVACLVTLAGCPALAVPAGFNDGGLPMGVQIVAPVHGEAALSRGCGGL